MVGLGGKLCGEAVLTPTSHSPSKKKMQCISNISITVMYLMYFLAALFGYLTFYGELWGQGHGETMGTPIGVVVVLVLTHIPGAAGRVESELLHTYSRVDPFDVLILCVRVAVLTAVTLTVPIVLFPVSVTMGHPVASSAHPSEV